MRAHAILSASGAHRWLNCPPSARLEEPLPDTTSVFAEEGTLAHAIAELELSNAIAPAKDRLTYKAQMQKLTEDPLYSPEMRDYVKQFETYALEAYAEASKDCGWAVIFPEQRLDYSKWVPEGFGTSDCTIIANGQLEIIDFKYGKGVEVSAEKNEQMMLYALGAMDNFGFIYEIDKVKMTIFQPRTDNISSWVISVKDLYTWAKVELEPKAQLAWEGKGEPTPGDWCKFCKVRARCRARSEAALKTVSDFEETSPNLLSVAEVADLLHKTKSVTDWAKDLEGFALVQARDKQVKFPGWKLVEGRSNRKYKDEAEVEKRLKSAKYKVSDIYKPREIIGITAMTKLLGGQKFSELLENEGLIIKPAGAPTLVPEGDKRPELNSAASDFDL